MIIGGAGTHFRYSTVVIIQRIIIRIGTIHSRNVFTHASSHFDLLPHKDEIRICNTVDLR